MNISDLVEQSLQQTEEYRSKFKNDFINKKNSKKSLNQIETKDFIQFPQKPNIPPELIGKLNENNFNSLIINSNIDKSDRLFHFN